MAKSIDKVFRSGINTMKDETPRWIKKQINLCIKNKFTGKLVLNFYEGGIANADKSQHLKPPQRSLKLNKV